MITGHYYNSEERQIQEVWVQVTQQGVKLLVPGHDVFWEHCKIKYSQANLPGRLILKYGNYYQPDTLNLSEEEFRAFLIQQQLKVPYLQKPSAWYTNRVVVVVLLVLLLLAALLFGSAVYFLPKILHYLYSLAMNADLKQLHQAEVTGKLI